VPQDTESTEKEWFIRDNETDPEEKNTVLSGYLTDVWSDLDIIKIDRIEKGDRGWQATYKKRSNS
jgi:hypothetical protein